MLTINRKCLLVISLIYIYLPIIIFVVTWTKPLIALLFLEVLVICAFRYVKNNRTNKTAKKDVQISICMLALLVIFFVWIGYYAGYGRFADQPGDWYKHNAILADLVNKSWPVYYTNGNEHSMLTYYIAQYIVPAAVGKLFDSFRCAEISLYVWNEIGIVLVFLYIISFLHTKKTVEQLVCALAIPFFSVPLWLSQLILEYCTGINTMNRGLISQQWFMYTDSIRIQYSNNFILLRWVFPQAITIWLIIMIMLEYRQYVKYYVLIMLPGVLYGTLSFLGILPLALGILIGRLIKDRKIFFQLFSFENVSVVFTAGFIFFFYLLGNVAGEKPAGISFHAIPYDKNNISIYIIFVATNIILYSIILFRTLKKDGIYYATFGTLIILPFFSMGKYNDLVMRTSIPALFVLMIYVLLFLKKQYDRSADGFLENKRVAVCLVLLMIGSYYPFLEFSSCVISEDYHSLGRGYEWKTLENFANRRLHVSVDYKFNYYSYDLDNNLFYKYIASSR